ncbi:methyltransferase domain-containing protein [Gemmobacter lutimaris]|uniref:Methyltransferase domain-containing protein n=1 Tax=Gemmobacter lutimaris TaxID=2306023 RepID=A0A398BR46_9RHOB|nr:methyltransferase domain-containing protein [Gemmobacter lutimaris]RID90968.1 methyltransferase domain-containing protein [Gemmobacter lutimaris]
MTPPQLVDRHALARNRRRARPDALFLHDEAVIEVQERLAAVNRQFTKPAIVTPFAEIWAGAFPDAKIIPDAEVLDLAASAHDLVIHAMALHWANDPVGQLVQCRRALCPDGLFIGLTLGGQTLATLRATLAEAEAAQTGGLSPRVLPMGEIRDLGALLQRAGLNLPVADSLTRRVSYRNALHLMADLRAMGEANAMAERPRHFTRRGILLGAAQRYETDADGRVEALFETICLTGWSPHDSQQKPLRPGSAVQRLEDALNAARTGATKNDS